MIPSFVGRDIISVRDFSRREIEYILSVARRFKKNELSRVLDGRLLGTCFFEASTRTRLSFESAMQRLGGRVVGFSDPNATSTKKGETLHDTIKIVNQYVDVIVMRHLLEGAPRYAAEVADIPVINAGDGGNEHPTQAFLDLFTLQELHKKIDGLHIALIADLKYGRGIHSLVLALKHFKVRLYFVAPDLVQMPTSLCDELKYHGVKFSFHKRTEEVLAKADILYLTRMQEERFPDRAEYEKVKHAFYLTPQMLRTAKPHLRILHIMPRVCEMDPAIDATASAYYFQQAKNGVFVRQALLSLVLGKIK